MRLTPTILIICIFAIISHESSRTDALQQEAPWEVGSRAQANVQLIGGESLKEQETESWLWDQPPNAAVVTVQDIVNNGAPVLYVSHDIEDHGWQFLGLGEFDMEDAMLVGLSQIVKLDPSIEQLADLPPGWYAWRNSPDEPWQRARSPVQIES